MRPGGPLLIASVLILSSTAASLIAAPSVGGGVSAGIDSSEINVGGNEALNVVFTQDRGPTTGGFVSVNLTRQAAIEIGGYWARKGSLLANNGATDHIHLTYLDAPVLFHYSGPLNQTVQLHVLGGGYTGYLLKATYDFASGTTADVMDGFDRFDVGWMAGFGLSAGPIRTELRYSGSINDISKDEFRALVPNAVPVPRTYRNRSFNLLLSYLF